MKLLFLYFGITIIGYFVGNELRKRKKKIKWVGLVQSIAVVVLVFIMGSRLGANDDVLKGLNSIGLTSFVLTIFALIGSVLSIIIARKLFKINREGVREDDC